MSDAIYPRATRESRQRRREHAPESMATFEAFSRQVFAEGTLSVKMKQLIAVAVAHVTQCPYCIRGHTLAAAREGATREQIMEAVWVAAEMRAGAAYAHSAIAEDALDGVETPNSATRISQRV